MNDLVFIISRYISNEENSKFWRLCYNSIRKFYPNNDIIIIDNCSNVIYKNNDIQELKNCKIIESIIPKSRFFVSLYYYIKYFNFYSKAVLLHDGIIFHDKINFDLIKDVKFLWHFENHTWNRIEYFNNLVNLLSNNENLLSFYKEKNWYGCLGGMLIISNNFLSKIENKFNISNLINIMDAEHSLEYERLIAVLTYIESDDDFKKEPSIMGDILNKNINYFGLTLNEYENNREKYLNKTIIKLFGSRMCLGQ